MLHITVKRSVFCLFVSFLIAVCKPMYRFTLSYSHLTDKLIYEIVKTPHAGQSPNPNPLHQPSLCTYSHGYIRTSIGKYKQEECSAAAQSAKLLEYYYLWLLHDAADFFNEKGILLETFTGFRPFVQKH